MSIFKHKMDKKGEKVMKIIQNIAKSVQKKMDNCVNNYPFLRRKRLFTP